MRKVIGSAVAAAAVFAGAASAATINAATNQIRSSYGGDMQITFNSKTAVFSTDVRVASTGAFLFNNQTAAPGFTTTITGPAAGEDLGFRFDVRTTGVTLFSGLAGLNIDGIVHALLVADASGAITVGFEDIDGGGDRDFDDVVFTVREVPVPGALALMATGLLGIGAARLRRKAA